MKLLTNRSKQEGDTLLSRYVQQNSSVFRSESGDLHVTVSDVTYEFKTDLRVPRVGLMMVGLGGNNGTTITGGILANKHNIIWTDKKGDHTPNFLGSVTQCSTMKVGCNEDSEIFAKLHEVLPLVKPTDLIIGGWDISSMNLAEAMKRA